MTEAPQLKTFHLRPLERDYHYSQAVRVGELLFISGTASWDLDGNALHEGNMEQQVAHVYSELKQTLQAHGLDFSHVAKETVYTVSIERLVQAAHVRARFLEGLEGPASAWVEVSRLLDPKMLLEVELVATFRGAA